jgi:hypothetical protein
MLEYRFSQNMANGVEVYDMDLDSRQPAFNSYIAQGDTGALESSCGDWSLFYTNNKPIFRIAYPIFTNNKSFEMRRPWDSGQAQCVKK